MLKRFGLGPAPDLGKLSFQRCGKGVGSLFELRPAWVNLADTVAGIFRPFGVFRIAGCETGGRGLIS